MEAILIFLAQSIVGGAVGHYVSEGLKNINPALGKLFENNADVETIEAFVTSQGLQTEVEKYAAEVARESYVIPGVIGGKRDFSTRASLFADVLGIGFATGHDLSIDLLLPGSFLGSHAFTLFHANKKSAPTIERKGTTIKITRSDTLSNLLTVFPVGPKEGPDLWSEYKSSLRSFRATTDGKYFDYTNVNTIGVLSNHCRIEGVSAGEFTYAFGTLMSGAQRKALKMNTSTTAPVEGPYESINSMLDGLAEVLRIELLSEQELTEIEKVYTHMDALKNSLKQEGKLPGASST